ncbi:MAG: magnesium chelatase subunit H [Anaerolineae bacterium]
MNLTFVTVSPVAIRNLISGAKAIERARPGALNLRLFYATAHFDDQKLQDLSEAVAQSDFAFIDLMGSSPAVVDAVYRGLERCSGHIVPFGSAAREHLRLGSFTAEAMKPASDAAKMDMKAVQQMQAVAEKIGKVIPGKMRDMRNFSQITKYFRLADRENILNMLYLILRDYGGLDGLPRPQEARELPDVALCDPATMGFYESVASYVRDFPLTGRPVVVLLFAGHTYPMDATPVAAAIKRRLEAFADVLPIAISGVSEDRHEKLQALLTEPGFPAPDLIVNLMPFRLSAGPMGGDAEAGVALLRRLDAACFHPYSMSHRTESEWRESVQGSAPSEVLISVMLPELDGCIETYPVAAKTDPQWEEQYDVFTDEYAIINERLEHLARRAEKLIQLRRKPNAEKRIAILCYNYPPGEANLFGGAFLDTFESVARILRSLRDAGYCVQPLSAAELMDIFTMGKAVNSGKYGVQWRNMIRYRDDGRNGEYAAEMRQHWSDPPGEIMVDEDGSYLIPGTVQGNVFVGLQPARAIVDVDAVTYHDKQAPPHYQYIAFYRWLRDEFRADAVIHVGTHGTLEFLKGKECGMSGQCYPDMLLGDLPHIYLYYCGNPSEAIIAKRRSHANLVSYQPPLFVQGDLYGEYAHLKTLFDNYRQAQAIAPQRAGEILEEIRKTAAALHLEGELEWIEEEIYRMSVRLIPHGLHVFGQGFTREQAAAYVRELMRNDRDCCLSLRRLAAQSRGYDLNVLLETGAHDILRLCDDDADAILADYLETGKPNGIRRYGAGLSSRLRDQWAESLRYAAQIVQEVQKNEEMSGLLRALSGRYNPTRLAGDIYRSPEVLPTGFNLHQFDPRLVPTTVALNRGARICNSMLELYQKENGGYPQSTAVILWGLETSQTQGETFAQILGYLGVRKAQDGNVWSSRFELIPLAELKRPRIDVTVNICGFFRDMFPNLINSLHDIFEMLYRADEADEQNYYKAHTKRIYRQLKSQGYPERDALELAMARVFGPEEGRYGTGLTAVVEAKAWQSEAQLGQLFTDSLQYVYTRNLHGRKAPGLYCEHLKRVDIVSQVRSSNDYEITDLDHYYEFFGGLAKSVELAKGGKARQYIADTVGSNIIAEPVERAIARGIRTRVLNPKWIAGMLAHPGHGAQKIADRFENVMGLAATTGAVDQWIYNDLYSCYVMDESLAQRMAENNPHAYMDILERMLEYHHRGYWEASEEQLERIRRVYLRLEGDIEARVT